MWEKWAPGRGSADAETQQQKCARRVQQEQGGWWLDRGAEGEVRKVQTRSQSLKAAGVFRDFDLHPS